MKRYFKSRFGLAAALVVAVVMSSSSCVKTYICHCDIAYSAKPGLPDSTSSEFNITDTKGNAETQCRAQTKVYYKNATYTVENCYLY